MPRKISDIVDDVETSGKRELTPTLSKLVLILGLCYAAFNITHLVFYSFGPWIHLPVNLCFASVLTLITYRSLFERNKTLAVIVDVILIACAISSTMYYAFSYREMIFRMGAFSTKTDIFFASLVVLVCLEITRRASGSALSIVGIAFILYALFGKYITGYLGHSGFSYERLMSYLYSDTGIFGSALSAAASYVFLFILFGSFLERLGGGQVFIDLATGTAGGTRGGPAKVAVVASALFGTISGSSVANVAGTGTFTIPLMKKIGYKSRFAAGVEAAASSGGQIMPPVMGSTAFILAEIVGVTYSVLAFKALVPAVLYFLAIFIMVDLEAVMMGLKGVSKDLLPDAKKVFREKWAYLLPIVVIFFMLLVLKTSTSRAAIVGILATLIGPLFFARGTKVSTKKLVDSVQGGAMGVLNIIASCSSAGIIIGILAMTGLGLKVGTLLVKLSQGNLLLMLMAAMVLTIILGMGLPTAAAYIVAASVVGPALTQAGIPMLTAHLFILYFAVSAMVTPPVALASYTAAGIAGCSASEAGWSGMKLSIAGFIVPYMFVYGPGMILEGSVLEIIYAIACSVIGILLIAIAVEGYAYFVGKLNIIQRTLLFIAAICIMLPGLLTDGIGIAIAVLVYVSRIVLGESKSTAKQNAD
ncbi:MAG: Sialic acid TRAP transporter permease protein SiaT [Firmicutes bacterium ADurb.Bin153]|nr:MAG: Sialic acid TRAP transporter permease protein SiaT [Firmicutes bacterium ADurb.Bin153]